MNELRVCGPIHAASGTDSDIPKTAEIPLFLFATDIHICPGLVYGFFRDSVHILSSPHVAFCVSEESFSFCGTDCAFFDAHRL